MEWERLLSFVATSSRARRPDAVLALLASQLPNLVGSEQCFIARCDALGMLVRIVRLTPDCVVDTSEADLTAAQRRALTQVLESKGSVLEGEVFAEPLKADARSLGVLLLTAPPDGFRSRDLSVGRFLAEFLGGTIDRLEHIAALEHLASGRHLIIEERELKIARSSEAVRARENLLAIVSHDLRNPLATVKLALGLIRRRLGEPGARARVEKATDTIGAAVVQMARVVSDLMDLVRIEKGRELRIAPTRIDAADCIQEAIDRMRPLAEARGVVVRMDVPKWSHFLSADGERLRQVLSNLLGNAIKFTAAGGSIALDVKRESDRLVFSVKDSGIGIDRDQLTHLFEPYWQARQERSGVGLGLSIAKAVVEAHGGRIWAESKPRCGSIFSFSLPTRDAELHGNSGESASLLSSGAPMETRRQE